MQPEPNSIYRKQDCPFGKKAVKLLKEQDIEFKDHILKNKEEEEEVKAEFNVDTTPQIFIDDERVGGYESLKKKFHSRAHGADVSRNYTPVIAIFAVTAIIALLTRAGLSGFMGYSLIFLATLKLMDLNAFQTTFVKYDVLAKVFRPYAKIYPFAELMVGLGFLTFSAVKLWGTLALCLGIIGGYSIFKAVYIDKRDLNCACVGGNTNVPLGAVSFIENLMMILMGGWMLVRF